MMKTRILTAATLFATTLLAGSHIARAIPMPDTGNSCTTTNTVGCFRVINTTTTGSAITTAVSGSGSALVGTSQSGRGVYGVSATSGYGVHGWSGSGVGVYAESGGDGVRAYTSAVNGAAAAVSAISPDNDSLAYWGTGAIIISGSLAQKAGGGSWSSPSDARIKKDVKNLSLGLAELKQVRPVLFKYNGLGGSDDNGREYAGVIAQELEKILPNMVSSRKGKLRKDDAEDTEIKIVDPGAFTYLLINAVKEQQKTIERQETRIAALERGRGPVMSSTLTGPMGACAAIGVLPVGLMFAFQRRKNRGA